MLTNSLDIALVKDSFLVRIDSLSFRSIQGEDYSFRQDRIYDRDTSWFSDIDRNDTGSFICKMSFSVGKNEVTAASTHPTSIVFYGNRLSFASSDRPQPLLIYGILGREAAPIEIPAGMAEYSLSTARLPSGHYFARPGNMTGLYEVY